MNKNVFKINSNNISPERLEKFRKEWKKAWSGVTSANRIALIKNSVS